jgi:hypothetical protein
MGKTSPSSARGALLRDMGERCKGLQEQGQAETGQASEGLEERTQEMKYFLIYNSDGDTKVCEISKEKFLREIEDGAWGESPEFLESIPDRDTNYWGGKMLIIKGEIVTLKKKEVVTKYDIE